MFTFLVVLATLIFLIPTSGLSLFGLAIYLFLKFGTKFWKIQKAITVLADEDPTDYPYCTVDNIKYSDVVGYAEGLERIQRIQGQMIRFKTNIKGIEYDVVVNKEPLGTRAILGAKKA